MRRILFLILLLASFVLNAQTTIWVTNGPSGAGTGTISGIGNLANPYHGDFDNILSNVQANTDVHLMAGTYWMMCNPALYSIAQGVRILGDGKHNTLIRRDNTFMTNGGAIAFVISNANCELSDFSFDCNPIGNETNPISVLKSYMPNTMCRRLEILNPWGNFKNFQECQVLFFKDQTTPYDVNLGTTNVPYSHDLIEECEIYTGTTNNYVTGITMQCGGTVKDCLIVYPHLSISTGSGCFTNYWLSGVKVDGSYNTHIIRNEFVGGNIGVFSTNNWETNVFIKDNMFEDQEWGINLNSKGIYGLNIIDNFFDENPEAANSVVTGAYQTNIYVSGSTMLQHLNIRGNLIRWRHDVPGSANPVGLYVTSPNPIDFKFTYNIFGTNFTAHTGMNNGCVWFNNIWANSHGMPFPHQ